MEAVLLWLDDLDDLLFAAVAGAESLRRGLLQIGLGAAVTLALAERSLLAPAWTSASAAGIAAGSVGLWLTVLLAGSLSAPPQETLGPNAA